MSRAGTSLGNLTFKNCKQVVPFDKFGYRKKLNVDSITGNKKFFRKYPYLKDFVKPGLPVGFYSEA